MRRSGVKKVRLRKAGIPVALSRLKVIVVLGEGRYSTKALIGELANAPTPLATSTWKDEAKLIIPPV